MTNRNFFLAVLAVAMFASGALAQNPVKRTFSKTDRFPLGAGSTVAITGAPNGSITVTGSPNNEVAITADVTIEAASEADAAFLAERTGFATDESLGRGAIITIGNHNKFGQKKLPKNIAKTVMTAVFRVDYKIEVPRFTELQIDGGKGGLSVTGVEGTMRINFLESDAKVDVIGGDTILMIGKGSAEVAFGVKGWRGRPADLQVASGDLTVRLPTSMSGDVDAVILKTGKIENELADLKPRDRKAPFTERSIAGRAGVGGAMLKFTVGDGTLRLKPLSKPL